MTTAAPQVAGFRQRAAAWLDAVIRPAGLRDYGATPAVQDAPVARAWQRMLFDAGWAGLSWPVEHGGRGASAAEQAAWAEETARRNLPRGTSLTSTELMGPSVIAYGTAQQQRAFLEPTLRGELIWCQLFSEPGAGSDLAGLRTRAVATEGGGWLADGRKVWSSGAPFADYGLLIAVTNPEAPTAGRFSFFLVPMRRPGIEVRPLVQLDGQVKFSEVFLDNVRLEPGDLLGEVGQGWEVANHMLGVERLALGGHALRLEEELRELATAATRLGRSGDPVFRQDWTRLLTETRVLRWTFSRAVETPTGKPDNRLLSVVKLAATQLEQRVGDLPEAVAGPAFAAGDAGWAARALTSRGATIAGGSTEVQRNIISERVLGLPREPRGAS
jgi:alkylation response protein AidB-like acyl-CoA dehydrogenase